MSAIQISSIVFMCMWGFWFYKSKRTEPITRLFFSLLQALALFVAKGVIFAAIYFAFGGEF